MKTRAILWSLKLIAASWAISSTPVDAGFDTMVFGEGFNVGGIEFRIAYGQPWMQGPNYYFEDSRRLHRGRA